MQFVNLHAQYLTIREEIDEAIAGVIRDSAFVRGEEVERFERRYADLLGLPHCVSCGNGTDALYIAMRALGLEAGDEVIVPAHTWIASSETVTQAGGHVVFADTERDYFCLDPDDLLRKITPRTKGVVVVHLFGQPARMDRIMEIARAHGLWVVEDCAQAHLARFQGRLVGTFGDAATFSFYPGKNLGAMGDAGCLVTPRDDVADFARRFARHGGKGEHVMEGINSRMDGLQAAVLNVKLGRLPAWTRRRREIATHYDAALAAVPGLQTPARRPDAEHVFHLYVVRVRGEAESPPERELESPRDALRAHLKERGVPTAVNYPRALPFLPAYDYLGARPADFPVAHRHQHEILSLPLYPEMEETHLRRVTGSVASFTRTPAHAPARPSVAT